MTFHGWTRVHTYPNRHAFILKYFCMCYRRVDCPAAQALTVCPPQAKTDSFSLHPHPDLRQRLSGTSKVSAALTSGRLEREPPSGIYCRPRSAVMKLRDLSVHLKTIRIYAAHTLHVLLWVSKRVSCEEFWNVTLKNYSKENTKRYLVHARL